MSRKLTKEEFVARANKRYGSRFTYENSVYVDMYTELTVTCNIHGDFPITPHNHLRGKGGCRSCTGGVALTTEQFIEKCRGVHGNAYSYDKVVYKNHDSVITITCLIHGDFEQVADYHTSGNGCQKCAGRVLHYKQEFLGNLPQKHKDNSDYDYSKVPDSFRQSDSFIVTCKQHGDFETTYHRFVTLANGCRGCSGHAKKTTPEFVDVAKTRHDGYYTYENVKYIDAKTDVFVTCPKHGDFPVTPDNHISKKQGCRKCCHIVSSHEDKLHDVFPFFERTNRTIISPYHLDMYSPEHKLAIEVNGRYWHSEKHGKKASYHIDKTLGCAKADVSLLHFWDDEIDYKFNIVTSIIKSKLGQTERIFARHTKVRRIEYSEYKPFFDENHLQGCGNPSVAYGLFIGGNLIAAMSFSIPRFSGKYEWEIVRFACKLNTTVVGGASKLFKAFVLDKNPTSVVTYADRRYSEGNLYSVLGFQFSHDSKPNYFYTKNQINISRYAAQKHKLPKLLGDKFDESKSESQNMLDAGFVKVYDCGNKVFTWRKN